MIAMPCIFCRRDVTLSAEHVFAKWIQPYLTDPEGGQGTHHRITLRAGQPEDRQAHRGGPASLTVRSVCPECNNGWMSDLEAEAKPYLLSMIAGHGRTYYERGQELIATWLVKTALVAGSKFSPLLPGTFYTDLYEQRRPSAKTRVWLAGAAYDGQHYSDYRPIKTQDEDRPPPETPNSFSAVLAVGRFAGMVVSWLDAVPSVHRIENDYGPAVVELLTGDPVSWPPLGGHLDFAGLDDLADAVVPAADVLAGRPTPN
jgi:hypothetical protein